MQNAAPQLGAALACEARAKPGGRPGISRASCRYRSETRKARRPSRRGAFPPSPSATAPAAILATSKGWRPASPRSGCCPVVITPGNVRIAGERRLAACAFLRWREVPVTVVDLDKVVKGEFAENSERKDLTLSEAVAIKRAIEPIERAEAKERQAAAGPASGRGKKNGTGSGKLPTPVMGRAARGQS